MDGWTSLAIVAAAVAVLAALLLGVSRRLRPPRGDALGAFLRHFDPREVPPEVARRVYRHLESWRGSGVVRAEDDLARVYGVDASELEDTLAILLAECGRRRPAEPRPQPTTAEELVRFIAACPADRAAAPGDRAR